MNQKASRRDIVRVVTGHLLNAANSPAEKSKWLQRLAAYLVLHGKTDEVDLVDQRYCPRNADPSWHCDR